MASGLTVRAEPSKQLSASAWVMVLLYAVFLVRTAWMADDALITLRTVHNVLLGFGPVWNLGERVQAYTHPLWMWLLSGAIAVTQEYYYTVLLLAFVISLATFYLVIRYLAADAYAAVLGGLILLLSKAYVDYSTSGLENPLTHLLLASFLVFYLATGARRVDAPRRLAGLALIAALGTINRLDTLLLFLPPLLVAAYELRRFRLRTVGALVAGFIPLVLWELFSIFYYGFPLPNTFYAKLAAGLPAAQQQMQGMLYLLDAFGLDPLTVVVIAIGVLVPLIRRDWRLGAVALGMALYLVYIARAGGDFMSGRFLSAPLLCAVVIIVQQPLAQALPWQQLAIFAGVILLGAANPAHSSWFTTAAYDFPVPSSSGVTDERGYYYQRQGLLNANRTNRLALSGLVSGTRVATDREHTMMGIVGFTASPYTRIVDILALTDPLLARLPAFPNPSWVSGHLFRERPDGYLGTLRTGQNLIVNPNLAEFYTRLSTVVSGPLLAPARWQEIWRFATGENARLVSGVDYQLPRRLTRPWQDFDRTWPEHRAYLAQHGADAVRGVDFNAFEGVQIELGESRHDNLLDLGWPAESFEIGYRTGAQAPIQWQHVDGSPLQLGQDLYTVVQVPDAIARQGYDAIFLVPNITSGYNLTRVAAATQGQLSAAQLHVADLLRLYYYFYYRTLPEARTDLLAEISAALQTRPVREWDETPFAYKLDLLNVGDPALRALVVERLPDPFASPSCKSDP